MVKRIQLSADDTTYYTLPGNTGELRDEAGELTDTIYGQSFVSRESGLITGSLSANALYKGFAGYIVKLFKSGTPTTMTGEAVTSLGDGAYQITAEAKRWLDPRVAVNVLDGVTNINAQVESIDYVDGTIYLKDTYTVVGTITVSATYLPMSEIAGSRTWTLTQETSPVDNTDIPTARTNSGHATFDPAQGLKSVSMELGGVFKTTNGWKALLDSRALIGISINPDNNGLSVAKGFFRPASRSQAGDVGALEEETITLNLFVPDVEKMLYPFSWFHAASTTLNQAVILALEAFLDGTMIHFKYLPDGTNGQKGQGVVSNVSLTGGLEAMNEFTVNIQVSGNTTDVP